MNLNDAIKKINPWINDAVLSRSDQRAALLKILAMRKSRQYRRGLLQMACISNVITQDEWAVLIQQVIDDVAEPALTRREQGETAGNFGEKEGSS